MMNRLNVSNTVVFALLLLMMTTFLNVVRAADVDEWSVNIVAVDLQANSVTLVGLGHPSRDYRMAFDIIIKLLSGESGAANSLQKGDVVTAIVDPSEGVVHALYVVAKP